MVKYVDYNSVAEHGRQLLMHCPLTGSFTSSASVDHQPVYITTKSDGYQLIPCIVHYTTAAVYVRRDAAWGVAMCRIIVSFARVYRVGVWFGFIRSALLLQEASCGCPVLG